MHRGFQDGRIALGRGRASMTIRFRPTLLNSHFLGYLDGELHTTQIVGSFLAGLEPAVTWREPAATLKNKEET